MLALYKGITGATRDPEIMVDYYTEEYNADNPVFMVAAAGLGFEHSPINEYYLFNEDPTINYEQLTVLTIDQDTSDGLNEHTWYQYRVLWEYENHLSQAEAVWSPWMTTLNINDFKPTTDLAGFAISVPDKVLRYYVSSNLLDMTRDVIFLQVRVSIPLDAKSQDKEDLTPAVRPASTSQNTNGGRP